MVRWRVSFSLLSCSSTLLRYADKPIFNNSELVYRKEQLTFFFRINLPFTRHQGFFHSDGKEEPLPGLSPQTPVSGYSWPRRTQVADKVVSPSCFRSSLPSCPFSWCPLCHSFCPSVVFESCNVSRPSMYSLLDNVYDIIYTCLMSYPGITFVVA